MFQYWICKACYDDHPESQKTIRTVQYALQSRVLHSGPIPTSSFGAVFYHQGHLEKIEEYRTLRDNVGITQGLEITAFPMPLQDDPPNYFLTLHHVDYINNTHKRSIHFPEWMRTCHIHAPMKTYDSSAVVLQITREPFWDVERTVVLDLAPQQVSLELQIMLEAIIKRGFTEGFDAPHQSRFSLNTLGTLWHDKIIQNLRYFCNVDRDKVAAERRSSWLKTAETCAVLGTLGFGAWLCSKYFGQKT